MADEYSRYRGSFRRYFIVGCALALAVGIGAIWSMRQESWIPLARDKLAKVEAERAVYEDATGTQCFLRIRIVNQSTHVLGVDLRDSQDKWKPFHTFRAGVNEGDHFMMLNEWILLPLAVDYKARQQKMLRAMQSGKTRNLVFVTPGAYTEYFASTGISRAEIARSHHCAPLWMRAKTYWPLAPFPLHFVATLRGSLFYSDGRSAKSSSLYNRDVGIRFPLIWKTLPERARLMSDERNTSQKAAAK